MELYQLAYVMYHEAVSRDSGTSADYQQMQDQLGLDITSLSLVHGEIVAKRSQKKSRWACINHSKRLSMYWPLQTDDALRLNITARQEPTTCHWHIHCTMVKHRRTY